MRSLYGLHKQHALLYQFYEILLRDHPTQFTKTKSIK